MSSVAVLPLVELSPEITETPEKKRARAISALAVASAVRPASALEVRPAPDMVPFGIASLDALTGGVPRGALTEMVGQGSSGRASVTMSLMAEVTRRQEVCAMIDATDSFDPASAECAGVDLRRVLWVRCGKNNMKPATGSRPVSGAQRGKSQKALGEAGSNEQRVHQAITSGCFEASHRRREFSSPVTMNEVAPPAKNISWSIHQNYDARLRHAMVNGGETREAWNAKWTVGESSLVSTPGALRKDERRSRNFEEARRAKWNRLDQALKATDLLIQSGGFGLIVIDLGDIPAEQARRIPLTSWFRFRRAVENTPTILLVIARDSCAKTCASLVLQMKAEAKKSGQWAVESGQKKAAGEREVSEKSHGSVSVPRCLAHVCLLDGLSVQVELLRTRLERKPARSVGTEVQTQTSWRKSG